VRGVLREAPRPRARSPRHRSVRVKGSGNPSHGGGAGLDRGGYFGQCVCDGVVASSCWPLVAIHRSARVGRPSPRAGAARRGPSIRSPPGR
jgi:hypothetical protein